MVDEAGAERTFDAVRFGIEGQLEPIDLDRPLQLSSVSTGLVLGFLRRYPRPS
jgi:hypothetical protein